MRTQIRQGILYRGTDWKQVSDNWNLTEYDTVQILKYTYLWTFQTRRSRRSSFRKKNDWETQTLATSSW
jgi:hypothetical protein